VRAPGKLRRRGPSRSGQTARLKLCRCAARIEADNANSPAAEVTANAGPMQFDWGLRLTREQGNSGPICQTNVTSFICNEIEQFRKESLVIITDGTFAVRFYPLETLGV
jgi:hypothetical protein